MLNQKKHKAEEDRNRNNVSPCALVHRLPSGAAIIADQLSLGP
jgi:hypothetical protein